MDFLVRLDILEVFAFMVLTSVLFIVDALFFDLEQLLDPDFDLVPLENGSKLCLRLDALAMLLSVGRPILMALHSLWFM